VVLVLWCLMAAAGRPRGKAAERDEKITTIQVYILNPITFAIKMSNFTCSIVLIIVMFHVTLIRSISISQTTFIKMNKLVNPILSHSPMKMTTHKAIRPSLDDVERISKGLAAKKRGTGSRAVPHRLNAEERIEWEIAKKKKYLVLSGSGWRKERGDSPLANIYRQYCDAVDIPCISVRRGFVNFTLTTGYSNFNFFTIIFHERHGS